MAKLAFFFDVVTLVANIYPHFHFIVLIAEIYPDLTSYG